MRAALLVQFLCQKKLLDYPSRWYPSTSVLYFYTILGFKVRPDAWRPTCGLGQYDQVRYLLEYATSNVFLLYHARKTGEKRWIPTYIVSFVPLAVMLSYDKAPVGLQNENGKYLEGYWYCSGFNLFEKCFCRTNACYGQRLVIEGCGTTWDYTYQMIEIQLLYYITSLALGDPTRACNLFIRWNSTGG